MYTLAILSPEVRERIAAVVRHAAEHVYDATKPNPMLVPGNDARHVVMVGNVRVVYTHTLAKCQFREGCAHLYHHLTMSILPLTRGKYPDIMVATEIAKEFGVHEPWTACGVNEAEGCAVILREIEPQGHA